MNSLIRRTLAFFAAMLITAAIAAAPTTVWERLSSRETAGIVDRLDDDQIEVIVREGMVYVYTSQSVTVSIFSILGQPITKTTIAPGGARFRLPTRGIYILKAGNTTRRITI